MATEVTTDQNGAVEVYTDRNAGVEVWNGTDVAMDDVVRSARNDPLIASLTRWVTSTRPGHAQRSRGLQSLFDRDRFVTPRRIFDQFNVARDAVENDDVVGGWMDTTENLAISDVSFSCDNPDEQDIWNQIAEDLQLDERMREYWRAFSTYSQLYMMVWWGTKDYKVQGKTAGGKRSKKTFGSLQVPTGITFLDPRKVVPVGNSFFNQEQMAWIADRGEWDALDAAADGDPNADPLAKRMIVDRYEPLDYDRKLLAMEGIDVNRLYLLNPKCVFRHSATRLQFERWSAVRMKPVFELLDLKHQLRQMDRSFLIGGINFILLVTQGSDQRPATNSEITQLNAAVRTIARVPLIVGDHRVHVEIVTPPQEHTLSNDKYSTLDARTTAYLYRMFMINHSGSKGGDDQIKVAKIVARGLQAARRRQGKNFDRDVIRTTFALNDQLTEPPILKFAPRRIELDFDPSLATLLLDVYDRGDLSRDTMLSLVDADQAEEAAKKLYEKNQYDSIFQTTVPFSIPKDGGNAGPGNGGGGGDGADPPQDPRSAGRNKGGRRSGGGAARPGSGQGKPPADGRPKTSRRAAAAEEDDDLEGEDDE